MDGWIDMEIVRLLKIWKVHETVMMSGRKREQRVCGMGSFENTKAENVCTCNSA